MSDRAQPPNIIGFHSNEEMTKIVVVGMNGDRLGTIHPDGTVELHATPGELRFAVARSSVTGALSVLLDAANKQPDAEPRLSYSGKGHRNNDPDAPWNQSGAAKTEASLDEMQAASRAFQPGDDVMHPDWGWARVKAHLPENVGRQQRADMKVEVVDGLGVTRFLFVRDLRHATPEEKASN